MSLVCIPWDCNVPCNTHRCYNRIAWRIVPEVLKDSAGAVLVGLCDECKDHLLQSLQETLEPEDGPDAPTCICGRTFHGLTAPAKLGRHQKYCEVHQKQVPV